MRRRENGWGSRAIFPDHARIITLLAGQVGIPEVPSIFGAWQGVCAGVCMVEVWEG